MTRPNIARREASFLLVAAALVTLYLVAVPPLWFGRNVVEDGPLRFAPVAPARPLPGGRSLGELEPACRRAPDLSSYADERLEVTGGLVDGRFVYACYALGASGAVSAATVLDGDLRPVKDVGLIKRSGAWRWIGTVKTSGEVLAGGAALVAALLTFHRYYRRPRPGPPAKPGRRFWAGRVGDFVTGIVPVLGWLVMVVLPGRSRARKLRLTFQYAFASAWLILVVVLSTLSNYPDLLSGVVFALLVAGLVWGWLGGIALVRPEGWGYPDGSSPAPGPGWSALGPPSPVVAPPAAATSRPALVGPSPGRGDRGTAVASATGTEAGAGAGLARVQAPDRLPTFADVGGMAALKELLSETFGLLLAFADEADRYRITFNGILLHGPTGVGKTFLAKATAGEFGLNFIHVSTGDLISKYAGESAKNVAGVLRLAAANVPCLLFFDEFDSVARRRDGQPDGESRQVVNQLLTSLEEYREVDELIVMAATNHLEQLDPAVVRPGRFDRHVRVDLPDHPARRAILTAQLRGRPVGDEVDVAAVADRTEGLSPAALTAIVEAAALAAFRESTASGQDVPITTEGLLGALVARGGTDRPTPTELTWDDLVLDARTKAELRQVQRLIEEPDLARGLGVAPPSGLLLAGPPGTGKTTIARVLAAQARCSFYAASAADLTSKWVGESEQRIQTLFARARDNAPSIVFLDEIDALARGRGQSDVHDRQLTQLLAEIDGLGGRPGVFVLGATNRPDVLDPALVRGGRLSRTVWVPLPDREGRAAILALHARRMPLAGVDVERVAGATDGFSGGDLEALCEQAAIHALMRADADSARPTEVRQDDFDAAVETIRASKATTAGEPQGAGSGERDLLAALGTLDETER